MMNRWPPSGPWAYVVAVAGVILATASRLALARVLGSYYPFLTYFVTLILTAWLCGLGPSILALALGTLAVFYFFMPPFASTALPEAVHVAGLMLYVFVGSVCIAITEAERRVRRRLEAEVAERLRAERALRDSEERFRMATEAVSGQVYEYDPIAGHVQRSCGLQIMVGYRPEEAESTPSWWFDRVEPGDRARAEVSFAAAVARRSPTHQAEYRVRHRNGEYRHAWDRALLVYDEVGRLTRMVGCTLDITERRRAEQELTAAYEFLHSSLDALSSHIAVVDEHGTILAVNDAWRRFADENRFSGHDHGVGANYIEACEPTETGCVVPDMVEGLKDVLSGRRADFEFEYPCHSPTENRWFLMRATRFRTPGPVRVVVAHDDVTKRRLAEEELRDQDRRKDEFLAMLAHELRNPLAPIRNAVSVLAMAEEDRETQRWSREVIDRQVRQLTGLVDDLLDVSRITQGKITLSSASLAVASFVQAAVESSQPLIDARGHRLDVVLPDERLRVEGDPTRLAQVVLNLLNNAAKYTPERGRIRLSVERDGDRVVIRVNDDGEGIAAEMLPRVFELFTQASRSIDRSEGGLGIGLTLVKRLVEMHGGTVVARSEGPGRGSEFVVTLPLLDVAPADASGAPDRGGRESTAGRPRRILVVDDSRDSAESLARLLQRLGHEILVVHDGPAAVDAALGTTPELALLDIGLPGMDGYEVARRLRAEPSLDRVFLVALTGYGSEADRRRSAEAGFDTHLVKPVEFDALVRLLEQTQVGSS